MYLGSAFIDPTTPSVQETPIGPFTGTVIKPRIGLTPILRAGLGMTDALVRWYIHVHSCVHLISNS